MRWAEELISKDISNVVSKKKYLNEYNFKDKILLKFWIGIKNLKFLVVKLFECKSDPQEK